MKKVLVTIWFLIAASLYIVGYGSLVLLLSLFLRIFKGREKAKSFVFKQIKIFGKNAFKWMFCPVKVFGQENLKENENYLVVPNHQSMMDIPLVLGYIGPMPMIAKKELSKVPGVNWFVKYMGGLFLDRKNPAQGAFVIRQMDRILARGNSLLVFPEGTRSKDGTVGKFKPAVFKLAIRHKVKVLPVSIWGTIFLVPKKSLFLNPGPVSMIIHPPLDPTQFSNEEELALKAEEIVRAGVEKLKMLEVGENEKSMDKGFGS
ncbi:1-acyl-sn-glycerol-3-phosphate acyltransferase [Pseudothermotoga thermarum DSM 5069]|uniref:1-acyl-sn-glycerol-3-phosphate acyltransferase n=1 Tax=Pseudothermotoga thermarum DSM 5069 TaxID=688269 RepID=F7YVX0_9THEM|nr:1-acyl-sn-glycerol-3-phosphate acyltransferase [Pseudothermotoga thermarum DSM 5069]